MRGTQDQRWAAVYGAAYYAMAYETMADDHESIRTCQAHAASVADEAVAAEPEEEAPDVVRNGDGSVETRWFTLYLSEYNKTVGVYIEDRTEKRICVSRTEAAALARLLQRFAETGEI